MHPGGVEHIDKTQRTKKPTKTTRNNIIDELTGRLIHEQIYSQISLPADKLKHLLACLDDDNLSTRIRFACKRLPEDIRHFVFNHTKANPKYTQVGNRFANTRNDIAHGNKTRPTPVTSVKNISF